MAVSALLRRDRMCIVAVEALHLEEGLTREVVVYMPQGMGTVAECGIVLEDVVQDGVVVFPV